MKVETLQVIDQGGLRSALFVLVIWAAILTIGCAPQLMPTPNLYVDLPTDPFDAVKPHFQNNKVDILYCTDRLPEYDQDGTLEYGAGRSPSLGFGSCVVEIGKDISWAELVDYSRRHHRPKALPLSIDELSEFTRSVETPVALVRGPDGSLVAAPEAAQQHEAMVKKLGAQLRRRLSMTDRKEAFVLVHGYHNTFEDPMYVMAGLWHFLGREGIPIVYSWPSGGKGPIQGYTYDRESGQFTVYHLRWFLEHLASYPELEKIHIISHSRGTDVATSALADLILELRAAGRDPRTELRIGNFVLAAPDLDLEVTAQRFGTKNISQQIERLTIYTSNKDRAIGLSDWLYSSRRRLGQLRPQDIPLYLQKNMKYSRKSHFIEADVKTDFIGHSYFHQSPAVSSDLILVLRDDCEPGKDNGRPLINLGVPYFWRIIDDYPNATTD